MEIVCISFIRTEHDLNAAKSTLKENVSRILAALFTSITES
jgi:hypothetical protein